MRRDESDSSRCSKNFNSSHSSEINGQKKAVFAATKTRERIARKRKFFDGD